MRRQRFVHTGRTARILPGISDVTLRQQPLTGDLPVTDSPIPYRPYRQRLVRLGAPRRRPAQVRRADGPPRGREVIDRQSLVSELRAQLRLLEGDLAQRADTVPEIAAALDGARRSVLRPPSASEGGDADGLPVVGVRLGATAPGPRPPEG